MSKLTNARTVDRRAAGGVRAKSAGALIGDSKVRAAGISGVLSVMAWLRQLSIARIDLIDLSFRNQVS
jgi:hypothetical protein